MARMVLVTILCCILANAGLVAWGRTSFVPLGLVAVGGALLAILLGVLGLIIHLFARGNRDPAAAVTQRAILLSVFVFLSFFIAVPVTRVLVTKDVLAARDRAEDLRPVLEARRALSGSYPDQLADIVPEDSLPRLLRLPYTFSSTPTSYAFRIRIPGTASDVAEFRSVDGRWRTRQ